MQKTVPDTETVEAAIAVTANCITVSRILFSLLLFVFSPNTFTFEVFYLICGVTDVLDGIVARTLHTESEKGAMLDSAADLLFAVVYTVKILPLLSVPFWIWTWTVITAFTKVICIITASKKAHKLSIEHSFGNKLTGILLFFLPLSVCAADVKYSAAFVCIVATVTVIKEIANQKENHVKWMAHQIKLFRKR